MIQLTNILPKPKAAKLQNVIHQEGMSRSNEKALINLYKDLVPGDITGTIDIPKIGTGFLCFMQSIGEKNFLQVLKHYGYGVRNPKKCPNIEEYLGGMRTIKNACFYLNGFEELVKKMADLVEGAPEDMDDITKAKVLRMWLNVFSGGHFFKEEFFFNEKMEFPVLNGSIFYDLNKIGMNPEQLLLLFQYAESERGKGVITEGKIRYSGIMFQLNRLEKKTRKEVLKVAELTEEDGKIRSVNECMPNLTFQNVRSLKEKIFEEIPYVSNDVFVYEKFYKSIPFTDAFCILWATNVRNVTKAKTTKRTMLVVKNGKILSKNIEYYKPVDEEENFVFSGQFEAKLYYELFEFMANEGLTLKGRGINVENGVETEHDFSVRAYMSALKYCLERKLINSKAKLEETAMEVERLTMNEELEGMLQDYWFGKIPASEVAKVAEKVKIPECLKEASEEVMKFVEETFNKELKDFAEGKTTEEEFKQKVGFKEEFSGMLNIEEVDGKALEKFLAEFKKIPDRNKSVKKMREAKFFVLYYCFLVENEIKCGAKNKTLKKNKAFKPEILKKIVA